MYRCLLALCLSLSTLATAAPVLYIVPHLGSSWYGLYLNGIKSGYALTEVSKTEDGNICFLEDAHFKINQLGVKQDMHIVNRRTYAETGEIITIEYDIVDPANNVSTFNCYVEGNELVQISNVGGISSEKRFPLPQETLLDALRHAQWVHKKPAIGDILNFSIFEPMYSKEIIGLSRIIGIEKRTIGGVLTTVYNIKTALDLMEVESVSYVTEEGITLEDVFAGTITMRLEPEAVAKDVNYNNDVVVSNAVMLDNPIENPRTRESLRLILKGPLTEKHLFNDERQFLQDKGDHVRFRAVQITADGIDPIALPVTDPALQRWLKPTPFIQSGDPRLIAKAAELIGIETDATVISNLLCTWVYGSVRSTFSARLTNALEVLENLEGDCTEHSVLFIGLARAAGLPAREVAGLIYVDGVQPGFYFHQWAKVWIGKWIDVDPTFNQPLADVTHIKLAEGDLLNQAKLLPIVGQLEIEVVAEAQAWIDDLVPTEPPYEQDE